ncbi:heavy metal translocating P-type ATPase [Candidatus Xianfuyuplasma coldseepsis]|uniref:Copper-exporting P-type ATPase n=1 Tax=Candidatus Xianfuyuplasma coldseepsis TaxID=2782163 RepID=A0A7L7KQI5_9MOLU|nr:heavy metal translocating P-type ATPase [Xianfuyuplasma coldseepsis]QMS84845.1 cadmium-translocating P-type ATPase [Xianfuyuplasma coldseepsis]
MIKKSMKVNGMTCAMCAKTITNTFEHYEGISANVNVGAGKVIFTYDEETYTLIDIAKIVEEIGYEPVIEENLDDAKKLRMKMRKEIYISVFFSIPLLWAMFSHLSFTSFIWVPELLKDGIFQLVVAGIVQFYIGKRFYLAAYHSIKKKVLGMDILVVMGTTSAYLYSIYLLIEQLQNPVMHPTYYFEISALIITMVLIGNYIEHIAKERTTDALVELMNLGAKEARVLKDGKEQMVDIDEVFLGDHLVVLANEKIPVDGKVVEGTTYIDESMITGESIPVKKEAGSKVIGATINQRQRIIIEATKIGSDTMLAQIIQHVEEASAEKPPIQRSADKIASYFVPIVVSIALLNFIIHFAFLGYDFSIAFERTIAILVISCPCALGLATPTSILVGNGKAAQHHILYKGGEFFELANKIEAIAFDKTGTLTVGKPSVTDYVGNEDVLQLLYSLEKDSNHPISGAVLDYMKDHNIKSLPVKQFETIEGKGIKGVVDGKDIVVGSHKLLHDLSLTNPFADEHTTLINQAKTVNFVIVDNKVEAMYAVRDEIKDTSKQVITEMKARGLIPYMITGDNHVVANQIAKELGIEHVHSEVLPHEKAKIIESIQAEGHVVAFVGDGINDAPALKLADVGIAMGHGTDVAIDSSDVTLMSYDLGLVIKAIDMSKATLKNIYQNFGWAFSYNLVAIPLAATGRLSMVVAAAAMAFSSITVVLNALRLKAYKLPEFKSEKGGTTDMAKLEVPDMTCNHCKMTIEKALSEKGFSNIIIDLDTKIVNFDLDGRSVAVAREAIEQKGYTIK